MKKYLLLSIFVVAFSNFVFPQNSNAIYGGNQSTPSINNTFIGYTSGNSTVSGTNNTFLGSFSGTSITTGEYNLFAGSLAAHSNKQGGFNVMLGYAAGYTNITGGGNTFVGVGAGNGIPGIPNTGNVSGSNNTYIGNHASAVGANAPQISNSTALGWNAKVSVNNAVVLGDTITNIKVGIGMTNPRFPLDVKGVVNMRVAYNNPAIKINDKDFLMIDDNGRFTVSNFRLKYTSVNQWADNVFASDAVLMTLSDVSKYINHHKHLPDIPSANEVLENGVEINTIISKMLKKIEELTLYTIEQKKEIEELKVIVNKLSKER